MNCLNYIENIVNLIKTGQYSDFENDFFDYQKAVENFSALIKNQTSTGKKIIFIGNGGSAGICSHAAIDYWRNGKMRSISFNDGALLTCISNDFGYENSFQKPVEMFADSGDVLIAISSSGKSKNIINAVDKAKEMGCKIITFSGFSSENPLRSMGNFNAYIPVSHYGFVELCHQIIIHNILDFIVEGK